MRTARRWIDYLDDDRADVAAGTRPMNFPVQGGAGDVMHRAMRLLFERYRDWPGNVLPVLTIHDEILVEADCLRRPGRCPAGRRHGRGFPRRPAERANAVLGHSRRGPTWAEAKADGEAREKALREGRDSRVCSEAAHVREPRATSDPKSGEQQI